MTKLKQLKFGILLGLFLCHSSSWATCVSGGKEWVDRSGSSITMALRSNACHYWGWAKDNAEMHFSDSKDLLTKMALVAGDAHHENFSHMFSSGERVYGLNDFDDVGYGPILLDLMKFLGVSRSIVKKENDFSTEELLKAYIKGLKEFDKDYATVANELPHLLKEDFDVTEGDFATANAKKVKKAIDDGQFKAKKDSVIPYADLDAADQADFDQKEVDYFSSSLPGGGYQARGLAVKDSGGSQGLNRFLYYTNDEQIIEFKPVSGTALSLYADNQPAAYARVSEAMRIYWPASVDPAYGLIDASDMAFYRRPKHKKYVDFQVSDLRKNKDKFAELSYFIAHHLGQKHGLQLEEAQSGDALAFAAQLESDPKLVQQAQAFTKAYLKAARGEHKR